MCHKYAHGAIWQGPLLSGVYGTKPQGIVSIFKIVGNNIIWMINFVLFARNALDRYSLLYALPSAAKKKLSKSPIDFSLIIGLVRIAKIVLAGTLYTNA